MKDAPFKSNFAILDVKQGRKDLAKRIKAGEKVSVIVAMEINAQWSDDDGTSIEFAADVISVKS